VLNKLYTSGILYCAAVHPESLTQIFAGRDLPVYTSMLHTVTRGHRNQVDFDAIPAWFIGHTTLEMSQPFHAIVASSLIFKFIRLDTTLIH